MIRKGIVVVAILLIVLVGLSGFSEGDTTGGVWTITVDDDSPFLGDPVTFRIHSVYRGEYVALLVEVHNTSDMRIAVAVIRMDYEGDSNWTWQTRLDDEPGEYRVIFTFDMGGREVVGRFQIDLVFDELDYTIKRLTQLEERLEQQNNRIMNTAFGIEDVRVETAEYILKPGILAFVTSIINILLITLVGLRYYGDTIRSWLEKGKKISWLEHAFTPQTDGEFSRLSGYEDVNDTVFDLTDKEFIQKCEQEIKRPRRALRVVREESK